MKTRNITIGFGVATGIAVALSMGQGQLGGGGLTRVVTNSPGLLAGSGTTSNPLTATISVGTGISGTGSAGSPLTASAASTGWTSDGTTTSTTQNVQLGDDSGDSLLASNSIKGAYLNYSGKHLEWAEEFMAITLTAAGPWTGTSGSGGATPTSGTGVSGRPGIAFLSTSTNAAGSSRYVSGSMIDLDEGTWSQRTLVSFPTLSTAGEEYRGFVGFSDGALNAGQANACFAIYDRGNSTTGGANASNANKWELCSAAASSRTCVILDGTTQGGVTTVDSAVAAGTYYNVLVTATTGSCSVAIDGTTRATITSNVPTAAVASNLGLVKTAGTTTRTMNVDYASLAVDLVNAR